MGHELDEAALEYHRRPTPGKLAITATKPLATQRDLSLAYTPGVAAACLAIRDDPEQAALLTARSNLVAVVSNGTAVLGLGAIGPLASKPVMEGKAVLFKKFSGIDVFDIEIAERDPARLIEIVAALEPTFGAVNLEDIKAPECFEVERRLRERMSIPVFHDDQHGTAIIVAAAVRNAMRITGKRIDEVKLVTSGAGAAALGCLTQLVNMGVRRENIIATDIAGVVYEGRTAEMDPYKARFAVDTPARSLADAIEGADIFLGVSVKGVLTEEMVRRMAARPLILALANPEPEIMPELAKSARPDAIIATGRSDFPNQVNNILCFPFIFRGALDVGATDINDAMKVACSEALADLAMAEPSELVAKAYGSEGAHFGPDNLIPKPFDPRLITKVASAVAQAAMDSGVATRPITDFDAYRAKLSETVFRSGLVMKPIFERVRGTRRRLAYAEGEERRVLRAAQQVVDERIARPILIGRPGVIAARIEELGLRMCPGKDYELVNIHKDSRFRDYSSLYHSLMGRKGVSPEEAKAVVRSHGTVVGALMLRRGEADGMLCGTVGRYSQHLHHVRDIIGVREGVEDLSALICLILPAGTLFIVDSHVTDDPTPEEVAEMTLLAAEEVRGFGVEPKIALLSRSNFGTYETSGAVKMRRATEILHEVAPQLEVEGEMHADAALIEEIRGAVFPESKLRGRANLLVMPSADAAHIAYNLLKVFGGGVSVGPILIGTARPAHVVTQSITVRGLVNMSAMALARSAGALPPINIS